MKLDHAAFYDLASKECDLLKAACGGACRLASMNIGAFGQSFNPTGSRLTTALATFELLPQPPDVAAKPEAPVGVPQDPGTGHRDPTGLPAKARP